MALRDRLLCVSLGALLTCNLALAANKRPNPPPQICIGSNCVTTQPPSTGSLKFHPGFYPFFNYAGGVSAGKLPADLKLIQSLQDNDNVAGIAIAIMWRTIDRGTTGPSYDWTLIDQYLAAVKAEKKRLWVRVQDAVITANASVANGRKVVPDWLVNKYGAENVMVNYEPAPRGVSAKRYNKVVTDAYIAMFQAMAARYDSDPNFEGVTMFEETAFGIDTSGSAVTPATPGYDYSEGGMFTQLYALMDGLRDPQKGFKTSNVQLSANYLFKRSDSAANWQKVFTRLQSLKMMLGGADSWIESWTYPNLPYDGPQHAGPGAPPKTNPDYNRAIFSDEVYRGWWKGSTDWRGKILFGPDVEITDIGGYVTKNMKPIPTLEDIWKVRGGLDKAQYFFFDINFLQSGNYGTPAQQWTTAQYPFIKAAGASVNTVNPYN
ncbi:MAG: hypothetical protein JSR66_15655 [Proteobacteria bacterium]|nr:hypothetical protein [Pseudomonadota bacterium]